MGLKLAILKRRLINTGFVEDNLSLLSHFCKGTKFLFFCGDIVKAEILRFAQSNTKSIRATLEQLF